MVIPRESLAVPRRKPHYQILGFIQITFSALVSHSIQSTTVVFLKRHLTVSLLMYHRCSSYVLNPSTVSEIDNITYISTYFLVFVRNFPRVQPQSSILLWNNIFSRTLTLITVLYPWRHKSKLQLNGEAIHHQVSLYICIVIQYNAIDTANDLFMKTIQILLACIGKALKGYWIFSIKARVFSEQTQDSCLHIITW